MHRQAAALAFGLLIFARTARAQPSGQDVATAQALFDEGKKLMQGGKYAEACPKLVESQRLDPGGGTLFAIALCHEGEGKTATAWAEFGLAVADARKDHRADREAAANAHIRALEAKLTRVRVVPPTPRVDGLEIRRDGARIGDAQWGTALPIDPGEHAFEALAPGKIAWRKSVELRGEGKSIDVNVPPLEDAPLAPTEPSKPVMTPPPKSVEAPPSETSTQTSSQKTWALVTGGAGSVFAGIGVGFALSASSKWNSADRACPSHVCTSRADQSLGADAGRAADVSTVLVSIGAAALVTGVVLWLTAPSGR